MTRYSLPAFMALAVSFAAAMLLLALYPSSAEAQRSPLAEGEPCPSVMYAGREELTCRCGKTEGGADVWGTDVYTDDSSICTAAVHAGLIEADDGGEVTFELAPGRDEYTGSEASASTYPLRTH